MSEIVEFLRARLDEEERSAKQQPAEWAGDWARYLVDPIIGPFGGQSRLRNVATGVYVAAHSDPSRVLAEIAAKRSILDHLYSTDVGIAEDLASVYSDHPDYRDEWRP